MKLSAISFFMFALIYSSSAFAISNEKLVNKCLDVGKTKVARRAEAWGCKVDLNQIEVQDIDNRWYNPSKYVWYQVIGECNGYDRVSALVQYYNGKCFQ